MPEAVGVVAAITPFSGPLITPDATARVMSWIDQALDTGAKLHTGGALDDTVPRRTSGSLPADGDRAPCRGRQPVLGHVSGRRKDQ